MLNLLKKIHNEEEGMDALQVVIILAIAFIALFAIWKGYSTFYKDSYKTSEDQILQIKPGQ